jgi:RHS repeat-associated protein
LPTTYKFTGQRQESSLGGSEGLYYYNARWYDPTLGRFAQADTVIPGGVQGLDRYAYVNNSPVNFTDPTGHYEETDGENIDCDPSKRCGLPDFKQYGVYLEGFTASQMIALEVTLKAFANALGSADLLKKYMMSNNGGNLQRIYADPGVGADASIRLGSTTFDMNFAKQNRYANYGAGSDEERAQIVLGHEIAHILISEEKKRSGVDWATEYSSSVPQGDGKSWDPPSAPEQEAVTNLALHVLNKGYYWNAAISAEEPGSRTSAINSWTYNFLLALKH